ncbi:MAG: sigma-70 family RNA polymerase sigma factor [Puniceicoccales bacterium]|jgi:RNA polymerase sigma-70 factor (ECF subfamily)|nr:sigma-70 family RNA polymerase sigma factor [Puniceicoccales bacterium]
MSFASKSIAIPHEGMGEGTSIYEEELALVARVREGDRCAFDILVKRYRERLYGMVYHMISNTFDAADLTQDIFIQAFRAIDSFQGKSSFFTWLYRIGVNKTLEYIRQNKRRQFFSFQALDEEVVDGDLLRAVSVTDNAEKNAYLSELQEKLNESLQKLSIKHRMVIILYEMEGMSHAEIAVILKCSEGTVRSRLHYAKLQLKEFLKEYAL